MNCITLTEENDSSAVKTRVIQATEPQKVTVTTKAFSRGVEFVVGGRITKEAGGLHIIQTYVSDHGAEEVQIMSRTARKG